MNNINIKHFYAAVKASADAALWLCVVSAAVGAYVSFSNLIPVVFIMGAAVGLASFFITKNEKLRYISVIVAGCSFFFCNSSYDLIITVPVVAYTLFLIVKENLTAEYVVLNEIFPKALFFVALAGFFHAYRGVSWGFMCAVVYTVFSIYLLRVLRYGDETGTSGRLAALELCALGAVVILCLFFSSKAFLTVSGAVGGVLYDYIVTPIVSLVFLIIYGGVWVVFKVGSLFLHEGEDAHMVNLANNANGLTEEMLENIKTQNNNAHMIVIVLKIVALLVFLSLAVLFFRRLIETMSARKTSENAVGGVKLYDEDRPFENDRPKFSDRSAQAKIRRYYASYCQAATRAGVTIFPGDTSRDVCEGTAKFVENDLSEELRGYYIRARYGDENDLTSAEVKRAHELSKKLKSQLKKD